MTIELQNKINKYENIFNTLKILLKMEENMSKGN